ncbi:MAG: hypothetical protein ACOC04_05870 [Halothece sp.]
MAFTTEQQIYSIPEYLGLETSAFEHHEYINGTIRAMAGGSPRHNTIIEIAIADLYNRIKF